MTLVEQLKRIVIAAPHLPIQMTSGIVLLIAFPILTFKGFDGLTAKWMEGIAKPVEHSGIQERIRDGEPEQFFKIHYIFTVNDKDFRTTEEIGFRTIEEAEIALTEKMNEGQVTIWYSLNNPNNATLTIEHTYWQLYFFAIGLIALMLAYFRWLFLKYYELEIEE